MDHENAVTYYNRNFIVLHMYKDEKVGCLECGDS